MIESKTFAIIDRKGFSKRKTRLSSKLHPNVDLTSVLSIFDPLNDQLIKHGLTQSVDEFVDGIINNGVPHATDR